MILLLDLLQTAISALLLTAAGRGLVKVLGSHALRSPSLDLVAGLVAFHLMASPIAVLDWPGQAWIPLLPLMLLALWGLRNARGSRYWQPKDWGVGDWVVATIVVGYALTAERTAGLFETTAPGNGFTPQFLDLASISPIEPSLAAGPLWSSLLLLAILVEGRFLLASTRWARVGTALLAMFLIAPALAMGLAGSPDWLIVLAIAAAMPALIGDAPTRDQDLRLGLAAALATASSPRGLFVTVLLVSIYLVRRWWRTRPLRISTLALVLLPGLGAGAFSLPSSEARLLLRPSLPDAERLGETVQALWAGSWSDAWHGMIPVLYLLLVALVARKSPQRWIGLFSASYLLVVIVKAILLPGNASLFAEEIYPRAIFHVALPVLLAAILELDRWAEGRPYPEAEPREH